MLGYYLLAITDRLPPEVPYPWCRHESCIDLLSLSVRKLLKYFTFNFQILSFWWCGQMQFWTESVLWHWWEWVWSTLSKLLLSTLYWDEVSCVGVDYGGRPGAFCLCVSEHMHTCASKYGLSLQCGGVKSAQYWISAHPLITLLQRNIFSAEQKNSQYWEFPGRGGFVLCCT